jgi:two-component system NtrC family sensor kinase
MDPVPKATSSDDASLRWLRTLLVVSVLAPALVFLASAWLDHRQTIDLATEHVDRTLRIAHEHALKVFETTDILIGRVEDLLGTRDADALRADEAALHERLQELVRTVPQVQRIFVLDAAGRFVADGRMFPASSLPSVASRPYFEQLRTGAEPLVIGGLVRGYVTGDAIFMVARRRVVDGRFAGVVGVSLYPEYLNDFHRELAREHPDIALVLYRADGSVITRYPEPPTGPLKVAEDTPWMRLLRSGAPTSVQTMDDGSGRRTLVALRQMGRYPVYIGSALSYRTIERDWADHLWIMLGFAVAAMLALGAVSWMVLRAAREERTATREWQNEAARREQVEQALRESQRMEAMGQLTGGVAHDFNNLLMVVNGNLQILRKRLSSSVHDRQLDAIRDAIGHGVTLTRHLLAFSRRSALQPRTIDLAELVPRLAELLSHSLRENIRLRCHVEPGTRPIRADPAELELALLNIAVNARDAMPGGGLVTIAARNATVNDLLSLAGEMSGEFVLIAVHDTGEGVPPSILNRVFEPFFTTKPQGKGTGLGLSQVYGFTRQSGGTVTLQSPPGKGTTVTLWLPRSHEPVPPRPVPRAKASVSGEGTILVVDDDGGVASVLEELLTQLGYRVTLATGGSEALDLLERERFDLLLTDVVMVGSVNGLQLARIARARHARMPIIVMTGYAAEIARIAAEGFTLLTKPFDLETLASAIEAKLEGEALI